MMQNKDLVSTLEIINLAATYGTPLLLALISAWDSEAEVTPEMIAKLKNSIKPADALFPELDE